MNDTTGSGKRKERSAKNGFTHGFTDEPIDVMSLQRSANLRRSSTANVEKARAGGTDRSTMYGISRKADLRLATGQSITRQPAVITGKRAALKRGGTR